MVEAVRTVPGVEMAGVVSGGLPLSGGWMRGSVTLPGRGKMTGDDDDVDMRIVTPEYLQILRIPLLRGRLLTSADRQVTTAVAVINEAAALKYLPGQEPLGQRMTIEGDEVTIVGIVGNIRHIGPEEPARQEAYLPLAQSRIISGALVMRTSGDPVALLPAVKSAIWSVNRDQILWTDRVTLESYMDGLIAQRRFNMAVLALFGVLAVIICAVGIYGVMAYLVSQRTREIGVRMALGASRRRVVSMVFRNAGGLVVAGLLIGGIAARILSGTARTFLFQLDARDPRAFAAAIVCLSAAAFVATVVPARRAASVDPIVALRAE